MTADQAHRRVRAALKHGVLLRPDRCSRCGSKDERGSDGRSTIHAHHRDYEKPLEVEWLCAKCHRADTPLPERMGAPVYGSRNGQAKLTEQMVAYIRNSTENSSAIARKLGVHNTTVNRVKRGIRWLAAAEEGK